MPTPASPGTNQFRCPACGRKFNTDEELKTHETECAAAKATGSGSTQTNQGDREEGEDREWVSTP
jgi:Zinc-finger double-stranded RNA-binding